MTSEMKRKPSRYDLNEIERMHDERHYRGVNPEYLARRLADIGLPSEVSRFQLSERIRDIERRLDQKSF